MEPILAAFLKLLPAAMADIPAFQTFWNLVKPGAPAPTAGAIDAILAALNPKVDGDIAGANAAATAGL